jgi:AcrR family transcriptional regulator
MNSKQLASQRTRHDLIIAAFEVIRKEGAAHLTLDNVARHAGVSKGGLLHHFPSKAALIEGVLRFLLSAFEERVTAFYAAEPDGWGRWLRAYVRASFAEEALIPEIRAVISMLIENQTALEIAREDTERWMARFMQGGGSEALIRIIQRAADAQWLETILMPGGINASDMLETLLQLIDQAQPGGMK